MKIAVCFSGQLRPEYRECFDHFKKFMISAENQYDIFISTWDEIGGSQKDSGQYREEEVTIETLYNTYSPAAAAIQKVSSLPETFTLNDVPINVFRNKFYPHYHEYKADLLRRRYELDNNFEYDVVIKSRPDVCHLTGVDRLLDLNQYLYHGTGYMRDGRPWNCWKTTYLEETFNKILNKEKEYFLGNQKDIKNKISFFLSLIGLDPFEDLVLDDLSLDFNLTECREPKGKNFMQPQDCWAISNSWFARLYSMSLLMKLKWMALEYKFLYPFDFWYCDNSSKLNLEYGLADTVGILPYNLWKYEVDIVELETAYWTLGRLLKNES